MLGLVTQIRGLISAAALVDGMSDLCTNVVSVRQLVMGNRD